MTSSDRRASDRRGIVSSTTIGLGAVLSEERRGQRHDRRQTPRRRDDLVSIAHVARRIGAGETRLEVIVDGVDGMRLVAMFSCGCTANEPIGGGTPSVRAEYCPAHAAAPIVVERRRRQR